MNRDELRLFARNLTLVGTHELDDPGLDQYLNEGYYRITRRQEWSWLHAASVIINPDGSFDLTTVDPAVWKVYDIRLADNPRERIGLITRSEASQLPQTGGASPLAYFREGNLLHFIPDSEGDIAFEMSYFEAPTWSSDHHESPDPIPVEWHTIIADWAVHRIWERQEDFDRSDSYRGRYEAGLEEMIKSDNSLSADRPRVAGQFVGVRRGNTHMPFLDGLS